MAVVVGVVDVVVDRVLDGVIDVVVVVVVEVRNWMLLIDWTERTDCRVILAVEDTERIELLLSSRAVFTLTTNGPERKGFIPDASVRTTSTDFPGSPGGVVKIALPEGNNSLTLRHRSDPKIA